MRRFLERLWVLMAVFLVVCVTGLAVEVDLLPAETKLETGATHLVRVTHADLTETVDNTAQTLGSSFAVAAKQGVELVAMVLVTPFTDDATNAFSTTTVTVGDGTDADLYLDSTELNSYGTEVFLKWGRSGFSQAATTAFATNGTVALTPETGNFASAITPETGNFGYSISFETVGNGTNYVTNVVLNVKSAWTNAALTTSAVWTNATAAFTAQTANGLNATGVGRKLYTSADYVDFTFTPHSSYNLAELDNGEVWFYLKLWDSTDLD